MSITREELERILNVSSPLEKIATLSSDGKNLLLRIPKEVREFFSLEKGDKFRFIVRGNNQINVGVIKKDAKEEEKRS